MITFFDVNSARKYKIIKNLKMSVVNSARYFLSIHLEAGYSVDTYIEEDAIFPPDVWAASVETFLTTNNGFLL